MVLVVVVQRRPRRVGARVALVALAVWARALAVTGTVPLAREWWVTRCLCFGHRRYQCRRTQRLVVVGRLTDAVMYRGDEWWYCVGALCERECVRAARYNGTVTWCYFRR